MLHASKLEMFFAFYSSLLLQFQLSVLFFFPLPLHFFPVFISSYSSSVPLLCAHIPHWIGSVSPLVIVAFSY